MVPDATKGIQLSAAQGHMSSFFRSAIFHCLLSAQYMYSDFYFATGSMGFGLQEIPFLFCVRRWWLLLFFL